MPDVGGGSGSAQFVNFHVDNLSSWRIVLFLNALQFGKKRGKLIIPCCNIALMGCLELLVLILGKG